MPIPWLTVLQSVPWSELISNAPKVAEGAKKLWKAIGRKSPAAETSAPGEPPASPPETPTLATLAARLDALESTVADVHDQLLASSELIKALAEQNALLVAQAESMRRRLRWLLAALVVIGSAVAYGLSADLL